MYLDALGLPGPDLVELEEEAGLDVAVHRHEPVRTLLTLPEGGSVENTSALELKQLYKNIVIFFNFEKKYKKKQK